LHARDFGFALINVLMTLSIKQTLLQRAAQLMGKHDLAGSLGVPDALLEAWMTGQASMPDSKLRILTDLLNKGPEEKK
jgi:hypothetical protein